MVILCPVSQIQTGSAWSNTLTSTSTPPTPLPTKLRLATGVEPAVPKAPSTCPPLTAAPVAPWGGLEGRERSGEKSQGESSYMGRGGRWPLPALQMFLADSLKGTSSLQDTSPSSRSPSSPLAFGMCPHPQRLLLSDAYPGKALSWARFLLNEPRPFLYPGFCAVDQPGHLGGGSHLSHGCPQPRPGTALSPHYLCVLWGRERGLTARLFAPRDPLPLHTFHYFRPSLVAFLTTWQATPHFAVPNDTTFGSSFVHYAVAPQLWAPNSSVTYSLNSEHSNPSRKLHIRNNPPAKETQLSKCKPLPFKLAPVCIQML